MDKMDEQEKASRLAGKQPSSAGGVSQSEQNTFQSTGPEPVADGDMVYERGDTTVDRMARNLDEAHPGIRRKVMEHGFHRHRPTLDLDRSRRGSLGFRIRRFFANLKR